MALHMLSASDASFPTNAWMRNAVHFTSCEACCRNSDNEVELLPMDRVAMVKREDIVAGAQKREDLTLWWLTNCNLPRLMARSNLLWILVLLEGDPAIDEKVNAVSTAEFTRPTRSKTVDTQCRCRSTPFKPKGHSINRSKKSSMVLQFTYASRHSLLEQLASRN